jgi:hypothetical protein
LTRRYYGTFDPASPTWPVPKVRVLLYIPNITTSWKSVDFLVDTGASRTLLNPTKALLQVGFMRQQLTVPQHFQLTTDWQAKTIFRMSLPWLPEQVSSRAGPAPESTA